MCVDSFEREDSMWCVVVGMEWTGKIVQEEDERVVSWVKRDVTKYECLI